MDAFVSDLQINIDKGNHEEAWAKVVVQVKEECKALENKLELAEHSLCFGCQVLQ